MGKQGGATAQTIKRTCTPRPGTFDSGRRDTVLDLTDLVDGRIDSAEFFAENYVTEGMRTLLTEGFRRLEGRSTQGVFKLTQAMGGGKTHNLLALGLLAKHPEYRVDVMGGFYTPDADLGPVRVVAFSGRESDAPLGIWGAIADQLGAKEQFKDYYAPLSAPGQTAWVNLLQGDPMVIMLDELPPYFVNAAAKSIGNSDLSVVTTTALSNLLVAVGRDELRNVCVVISDLKATYGAGGAQIGAALGDLEAETGRSAMNLEPVHMNTDEFYHILRRRLFERLPDEAGIEAVAQAYGKAVREAKQMDVTNASPEQFAADVKASYPFHPAIRDLYARFRENQGFQQTRGLIRLMRIVVSRIWATDHDPYLSAAHDIDLGSQETLTEINNTLGNAIAHDVASGGNSVAERLDASQSGGEDAQDVMRLLLIASLANVPNALKGLTVPEIVADLCAPGRDVSRIKNDVIARLATAAWYLHSTNDGRLHVRDVQNLVARVTTTAGAYLRDQATREVTERLREIFRPDEGSCYQRLLPLPAVDEIDVGAERVTLIVAEPHPAGLHPDLRTFYDQHTYRNRLCFLTGQQAFDSLLESARELKAVNQIIKEMHEEGVADGDTQMQQARDDSKRALAVQGADSNFRRSMVDCYRNLAEHMPINGVQAVMFTHQDAAVWADLALILWAAGLRVTAAWTIATETESALKEGNYVQGTVLMVLRKQSTADTAFLDEVVPEVETEVERQLASMRDLDDRDAPNFSDADYQLAAYAAALRVLTTYRSIEDVDVSYELSRERGRGEANPLARIIEDAVRTASSFLVPAGLPPHDVWLRLAPEEKLYLKGLEVESHGDYRAGVYQEFARGFGVADYRRLLHTGKANQTRLKTASELQRADLADAGLLRRALYAVWRAAETGDVTDSLTWLHTELGADYWSQRPALGAVLRYLATRDIDHWRTDVDAARLVAGAVENDHV